MRKKLKNPDLRITASSIKLAVSNKHETQRSGEPGFPTLKEIEQPSMSLLKAADTVTDSATFSPIKRPMYKELG